MANSRHSIGLLGGSFDPVHNGHLSIVRSFLESEFISKLWILLTPDPPHKTDRTLSDYEHRFKMLKAAFRHFDAVKITDIENKLPRPSYTIQTLQYLVEKYPDQKFYLCMGEDSLRDFKQWKNWKDILNTTELLVARRPSNRTIDLDSEIVDKTHFIDHEPVNISSTEIRDRVAKGKDITALVPGKVHSIITKANLYQN